MANIVMAYMVIAYIVMTYMVMALPSRGHLTSKKKLWPYTVMGQNSNGPTLKGGVS